MSVKSADRVLAVLDLLAVRGPLTFTDIATALDLPKSSTHNLLQTMVMRGYVGRDAHGAFALGLRVWEIGQACGAVEDLRAVLRPVMDDLGARTQETIQAARLDGAEAVYVEVCESPHPMKLVSRVGSRLPAHASGVGKALLAELDPADARARLEAADRPAYTDRTIVDVDALMDELRRTRERGYALDGEEFAVGLRCVAMPVRDAAGEVVAAMSVAIPTPRYSRTVAATAREALAAATAEATRRLTAPG